jgi:hypothetical protein
MVLVNGASASNIFWALGSYLAVSPGASVSGMFLGEERRSLKDACGFYFLDTHVCIFRDVSIAAQAAVTVTRASVSGGA